MVRNVVAELFERHAEGLQSRGVLGHEGLENITSSLKWVERYWTDQIRYIYERVAQLSVWRASAWTVVAF